MAAARALVLLVLSSLSEEELTDNEAVQLLARSALEDVVNTDSSERALSAELLLFFFSKGCLWCRTKALSVCDRLFSSWVDNVGAEAHESKESLLLPDSEPSVDMDSSELTCLSLRRPCSYSHSWPMKLRLGEMMDLLVLTNL